MDTTDEAYGDAINAALANLLEHAKLDSGETYPSLAEKTGISVITLKRLLDNQRPFKLSQYFALTSALGVDAVALVVQAEEIAKSA